MKFSTQIDYTTRRLASWGGPYNAILDCASTLGGTEIAALLSAGGRYVRTLPRFPSVMFDPLLNPLRPVKRYTLRLQANADDLRTLLTWLRRGRIKPLISERFALNNAVAALEVSRSGHAREARRQHRVTARRATLRRCPGFRPCGPARAARSAASP